MDIHLEITAAQRNQEMDLIVIHLMSDRERSKVIERGRERERESDKER